MAIGTAKTHRGDSGYDNPLAWEAVYEMLINDSITITPAVFVMEKDGVDVEDISGAIVKITFGF